MQQSLPQSYTTSPPPPWRIAISLAPVSSFFIALNASTLFLLSDPYSLHLVGQKPFPLLPPRKKLEWALNLQLSSRGIGWNWEVPYLRPPLATTRGGFVVAAGKRLARLVLLREVAVWLLHYAERTEGWKGRLPLAVGQICWSIITMEMPWLVAMIVLVGTGMVWGDPKMARPLMGGVWDVYTVRRFWGRGWHQTLRRVLQSHGRYLCGVFGAKKGGALSNYTQVFTAFTLCGIGHWFGNYAVDPTRMWVWTMVFFVGQGGAIMVEDFVIAVGQRCGVKDGGLVRMLGRVWVVGWFVFVWPCGEL
ncbi:hypothetical protein K440DRAFT_228929 [Wilcoxina mikolae CBS 423.85]|nr:hypothetical protein K440DRAFT_228929 [Wilcoxina mikolae CBS 423.85]